MLTDYRPLTFIITGNCTTYSTCDVRHLDFISKHFNDICHIIGDHSFARDPPSRVTPTLTTARCCGYLPLSKAQTEDSYTPTLSQSNEFRRNYASKIQVNTRLWHINELAWALHFVAPALFSLPTASHFCNQRVPATRRLLMAHFIWLCIIGDVFRT